MGVPLEVAREWERHHEHFLFSISAGLAVRTLVVDHFATARTKDWTARREDYWNYLEKKLADERWAGLGHKVNRHFESRERKAHDLRSATAACRKLRIGNEFHGFMDLPREIRDMVYSEALTMGQIVVPDADGRLKYWQQYSGNPYTRYAAATRGHMVSMSRVPARETSLISIFGPKPKRPVGLIQGVSRAVQIEATAIFYGSNQLVFPAGPFRYPLRFNTLADEAEAEAATDLVEVRPSWNYAPLARDVSYTFDMRDDAAARGGWESLYRLHHQGGGGRRGATVKDGVDGGSLAGPTALALLHDRRAAWLEAGWAARVEAMGQLALERLALSFEECYCAVGCCRKVGWVLDRLAGLSTAPGGGWRARGPPRVVEVTGWVSEREREMMRTKLEGLGGEGGRVEVRFVEGDGEEDGE